MTETFQEKGRRAPTAPTPWLRLAAMVALLTVVMSIAITAFAWPATRSEPRDVPIVAVGSDASIAQIREQLAQVGDGYDVTEVDDREGALDAIEDRDAYGAILVGDAGVEVLTASAANAIVAQSLGDVASSLSPDKQSSSPMTRVTDVVPAPGDDSHGWGLSAGMLPLLLGSLAAGGAFATMTSGVRRRLAGVVALGITGGLAMAAIWQVWLGALDGPYLGNVGVIGLAVAASATVLIGLYGLFNRAGFGAGAATLLLVGNPLSGVSTAPEMLPTGWGGLGQILPPGATGSLLRSVDFFDGAGSTQPLIVLLCWFAVGLALCLAAARIGARKRLESIAAAAPANPGPTPPVSVQSWSTGNLVARVMVDVMPEPDLVDSSSRRD